MTWGINLGLNNATNAANMANSILKAFSSAAVKQARVFLDLIEIGMFPTSSRYNQMRVLNGMVRQ